jgi:homocysteine S-methyltransferase
VITNPFKAFLDQSGVVILDGALATELERRGADLRDPLWSARLLLENPDLIRQVHLDYFEAGADVAITATYQATFAGFARRGLTAGQAAERMRLSVALAREARAQFWSEPARRQGRRYPLVAASVGCFGSSLHNGAEYRGDYGLTREQLMDFHRPRLEVLARSGADLLACETIPCQVEAEALARVLEEFPETPAWISFSCRDDRHVCHGELLADCLAVAEGPAQVVATGINCTPPAFILGLLATAAGTARKPLLVYPNRGERWEASSGTWIAGGETLEDWGTAARAWYAAGARLIGGCCRSTPEDIRQVSAELRRKPS